MSGQNMEQLRKELKQWEAAFYIVHQRKPGKNDVAQAPKDVKDKYKLYFQEKKKLNHEADAGLKVQPDGTETQTSGIWGVELNVPQVTNSNPKVKESKTLTSSASLDKLGAKLFQNFTKTQSPKPLARKKSVEVCKSSAVPAASVTEDECEESLKEVLVRGENEDEITSYSQSLPDKSQPAAFAESDKQPPPGDGVADSVVQGELFKVAGKVLNRTNCRSNYPMSHKFRTSSRPRLSFLSVKMPAQFGDDGNGSNSEIQSTELPANSASRVPEAHSDSFSSRRKIETSVDMNEIFQDSSSSHINTACETKNIYTNKSWAAEDKIEYTSAYNFGSLQFLSGKQQKNEKRCFSPESFSDKAGTSFDNFVPTFGTLKTDLHASVGPESFKKAQDNLNENVKTEFIDGGNGKVDNTASLTVNSFMDYADSCAASELPEEQRAKQEKLLDSSSQAMSILPLGITLESKRQRSTTKSERSKARSRKVKKSSDTQSETQDDFQTSTVPEKKTRQRKRSAVVSDDFSGDAVDDFDNNVPEQDIQDVTLVKESAVKTGSSSQSKNKGTRKLGAASLSENYVCLNMKRKGYRRKGAGMTGPQLKRKLWKAKMAARSKSFGSNKCFKCGQEGHWASQCKDTSGKSQDWTAGKADEPPVEESEFPTLREAALMSRGIRGSQDTGSADRGPDDISDIEATIVRETCDQVSSRPPVPPLADHVNDITSEMKRALSVFGFPSFRPGQVESISRVLRGLSTLVVLTTGGGKSLCYQLPAYLYARHLGAVTLVISPLVSLMEDQVTGLPPGVVGACLHSSMTSSQRELVISSLRDGKIHFLLVSPETIVERGGAVQGSLPPPNRIPPIAFACIDEAHCLSEWSHNFRPSYLRLCKVLRRRYGVRCFLGLTATATRSTSADVARHLGILDPQSSIVRGAVVRPNLLLSASRDENRDEALVNLLKGERFRSCESIIIYCSRRESTERVATIIRTSMQTSVDLHEPYQNPTKKRRLSKEKAFDPRIWTVESYHAGLTAAKRKSVQRAFMTGKLRVVVATVAFGMGLDKASVRAVIHYNMAKSFESYVQEIGRAGRDGQVSHCHVFLNSQEDKDLCELRRHTYANGVDRVTLKKLLGRVLKPCRCSEVYKGGASIEKTVPSVLGCRDDLPPAGRDTATSVNSIVCGSHERAMSIEETVQLLDVREEGISTLLSYLEIHPESLVENLSHVYSCCSVSCYGGPRQLMAVAKKCPPVAMAIARQRKEGKNFSDSNRVDFSVIDLCDSMGWDSGVVKQELLSLQWESGSGVVRRTGVRVELSNLAFHFRSRGDLTSNQIDGILDYLYLRTQQQENAELKQLDMLSEALKSVSYRNYWMCSDDVDHGRSDKLKDKLTSYFDSEGRGLVDSGNSENMTETDSSISAQLSSDIRHFISLYGQDHNLTGRAIARIFHGIGSPCYPAETWGRVRRFWRSHLDEDFHKIIREATKALVAMR